MRFGAQALEAHQHTLFRHLKNEFFSRYLVQNMPKNAYLFLEKRLYNYHSAWGSAPEPPLTDIDLSKYVSSVNLFYYGSLNNNTKVTNSKCYAFASSALLAYFSKL